MKMIFYHSSNFIKLQAAFVIILLTASLSAAQTAKTQKVSWKGLGDKKDKFFFQIPDGFRYFEDGTIYIGTESNPVDVKNMQTVSRYINDTVLMLNIYEGKIKDIQPVIVNLPDIKLIEEKTSNGFQIKSYILKSPDFILERQHFYDADSLFVMSAFYRNERTEMVGEFFKSVRLFKDGKGTAPNFPKDAKRETIIAALPDIAEKLFSDEVEENPDKKAVIIYRPRPAWNIEFGRSNKGIVKLNVLLASTGKVSKVKNIFIPTVGMADGVKASAENIVFLPAIKDGNPVSTWEKVEYKFGITITGF